MGSLLAAIHVNKCQITTNPAVIQHKKIYSFVDMMALHRRIKSESYDVFAGIPCRQVMQRCYLSLGTIRVLCLMLFLSSWGHLKRIGGYGTDRKFDDD